MTTINYFQIKEGSAVQVLNGKHQFKTFEEAKEAITSFKADPKKENKHMSEENVRYWKGRSFIIEQVITITQEHEVI